MKKIGLILKLRNKKLSSIFVCLSLTITIFSAIVLPFSCDPVKGEYDKNSYFSNSNTEQNIKNSRDDLDNKFKSNYKLLEKNFFSENFNDIFSFI